jgi:hypothetical protein
MRALAKARQPAAAPAPVRATRIPPRVQPQFKIGPVDDPLEREADRMADAVMAGDFAGAASGDDDPTVRRACCSGCGEGACDEDMVRRKPALAQAAPQVSAPALAHAGKAVAALASGGAPLPAPLRSYFEPRFNQDFSHVRLHTGSVAAQAAAAIGARAYTLGSGIAFAAGEYAPATAAGVRLLAHELAHVAQQSPGVIRRQVSGCASLIAQPSVMSIISGREVHAMIERDFSTKVKGAVSIGIPGASAGPQRSSGICGEDTPVVTPQSVGGKAGTGYPDLAGLGSGGVLSVAEVKPAVLPCLIDGEEQELRYIDQGNGRDAEQATWRQANGIKVVSPMLAAVYKPPSFNLPTLSIRTAWCTPGLLGYSVRRRRRGRPPVTVPVPEPVKATRPATVRVRMIDYHPAFETYARDLSGGWAPPGRNFLLVLEAGLFAARIAQLEANYIRSQTRGMRIDPRSVPLFQVQPVLIGGAVVAGIIGAAVLAVMLAPALPALMAAASKVAASAAAAAAAGARALIAAGQGAAMVRFVGATASVVVAYLVGGGMKEAEAAELVKPLIGKSLVGIVDVTGRPEWDNPKPGQTIAIDGQNYAAIVRLTSEAGGE